jgi:RND superfamily putative drug exporter
VALSKRGGLERFARWVSGPKTKWVILAIWIVLAGVCSALLPQANSQENNNAANLSGKYASVQGEQLAKREFPTDSGQPALIVWHRQNGLTDDDLSWIQKLSGSLEERPLAGQQAVVPLHRMPAAALRQQVSEDGTVLVMTVIFQSEADADALKSDMNALKERASEQMGCDPFDQPADSADRMSARISGPAGISVDASALFKNADVSLLMGTVLLVLIILLLIYRSPILALIPLVGVCFAYAVANPLLGWMAREGWITVDAQALSIMTVLLFGAGTDYCLFLVARFRRLLHTERNAASALRQAVSGTSGAIAMSGFTVVLSLLALLLAEYGTYDRFAVPFSLSILIMGIASLTLVPALLAIFGRASFYPFVPRTEEMQRERAEKLGKPVPRPREAGKFGAALGSWIVGKPVVVVLAAAILLGALAGVSARIPYTFDTLSSFPKDMPSRQGFTWLSEKFSPGELAPVKVMLDTEGRSVDAADALRKLNFVSKVSEPQAGKTAPNLIAYDVEFNLNPYSNEAMDRIPDLRRAAEEALASAGVAGAEEKVWLSGRTVEQYDTRQASSRDARAIIPVVIVLIALLLLVYLRSVVAMVYLMATVLLSYFSALGLGWLIIHYGLGADAIQGFIPLYSFVFLVALGEDYNIFMVSSIWKKSRSMPLRRAIREGVAETGSVITSAGLILAGTFAVLATLPIQVLVHFGIITAIGVLLDTFVVRPFLVPAITVLLGRAAFWPGRFQPVQEAPSHERDG